MSNLTRNVSPDLTGQTPAAKDGPKHIVLVGHCSPDASFLTMSVTGVLRGVKVSRITTEAHLQTALREGQVDLILVNRVLEPGIDDEDGVALIKRLHLVHPKLKFMLVSNYEDSQQHAQTAGALMGFGKNDLRTPVLAERLKAALISG